MKKTFKPLIMFFLVLTILTGCTSTTESYEGTGAFLYEDSYEVAGYRFVYRCYDNHLTINYIDFFSASEIEQLAGRITDLHPTIQSYDVVAAGQVLFTLSAKPDQELFDNIVSNTDELIYDYFY